jgi:hypothetical protein
MKNMKLTASLAVTAMTVALTAPAADLPDPDGKPADMSKPVQVLILMGQSNMLGFGKIGPADKDGTLEHAVKTKGLYPYLVDDEGNWTVRNDVRYVRVMNDRQFNNEFMTIKGNIGPEIGIGHYVGNAIDAPVMILKSCIGNRSLGWDLLPPGTPRYSYEGQEVPGYREYKDGDKILKYVEGVSKVIGTKGRSKGKEVDPWYAGKQYDSDIAAAKRVLADLDTYYPGAKGYEVVGFCWWQGDKDRYNAAHAAKYEENLIALLKALRKDFDAPDAKLVIATLGQTNKDTATGNEKLILDAMFNVADPSKYPENKDKVATFYSHPVSKGGASNGHYNKNAETYMNVGEGMGAAMAELLTK